MKRFVLLALMLPLLAPALHAQPAPLGRLFLDPQQRARLDQQRQRNPQFLPNLPAGESRQTFNGEVRRSDGKNTRWINGEADWSSGTPAPRVPVGDTIDPGTGQRESLLGDGRITVRRPPVRP